jgi:hypothetical protein
MPGGGWKAYCSYAPEERIVVEDDVRAASAPRVSEWRVPNRRSAAERRGKLRQIFLKHT